MSKRQIIYLVFGLVLLSFASFLIYRNYDLKNKKRTLMPRISTETLPTAFENQYYFTNILATLVGIKSEIDVEAESLPEGINLVDCTTSYNNELLPKPNSVAKCTLTGYPIKKGVYEVKLSATSKGFTMKSINRLQLNVMEVAEE